MTGSSLLSVDPELAFVVGASGPAARPDPALVRYWERVVQLAVRHRVFPRVWNAASSYFPPAQAETLRLLARQNARAALLNLARTIEVARLLRDHSIEPIVLKGPLLSYQLYGQYAARVSGDIDLLVAPAELLPAAEALAEAGYQHHTPITAGALARHLKSQHDIAFAHPVEQTLVELHVDIAQPHYGYRVDLDRWREERQCVQVGGAELAVLSREHAYLLAGLHAAKHRWDRLDLIADMAAYGQIALDFGKIEAEASQAWMLRAIRTGQALVALFYGDAAPPTGVVRDVSSKVVASQKFGRLGGLWLDLRLRERTRDQGRYLLRRLLSAKLRV
jgi:hypothetical protein